MNVTLTTDLHFSHLKDVTLVQHFTIIEHDGNNIKTNKQTNKNKTNKTKQKQNKTKTKKKTNKQIDVYVCYTFVDTKWACAGV